jgi:hypothetical protein
VSRSAFGRGDFCCQSGRRDFAAGLPREIFENETAKPSAITCRYDLAIPRGPVLPAGAREDLVSDPPHSGGAPSTQLRRLAARHAGQPLDTG